MRSVLAILAGAGLMALASTGSANAFMKMPASCGVGVPSNMDDVALVFNGPWICGWFAVDTGSGGGGENLGGGGRKVVEYPHTCIRVLKEPT